MDFLIVDDFYPKAKSLRQVFDRKFAEPLVARRERFVWDFWHVPGQYTHLRTPAFEYFPKTQYESFHRYLVRWGRENLGCHDISPPWLSCYIEGCRQNAHRDTPHGPLAFVYSLSHGGFRGGETFIRRPKAHIAPRFNRLTLFNPDLVHGVREVRGTLDPRMGRLVVHGWFVQPRPFWVGPLTAPEVQAALDGLDGLPARLGRGFVSLRVDVSRAGHVVRTQVLADTRRGGTPRSTGRFLELCASLRFTPKRGLSQLTIPFMMA